MNFHNVPGSGGADGITVSADGKTLTFNFSTGGALDRVRIITASSPSYVCLGFDPPLASGPVTVKKNRVLPLKAQLLDSNNNPITDVDISVSPVIQIIFTPEVGPAEDVTGDALASGQGTEGNQFVFNPGDGKWHFNLKTKNYTAPGTYMVFLESGDESEYVVDPFCVAEFVIQ
jgi:hypothetical protein